MPYKSCTSSKQKNKVKRFTNHQLVSFSHFDETLGIYSTINGEIFLYNNKIGKSEILANIKKTSQQLIPNYRPESDYVTMMDTYNKDCFVGTSWGIVYLLANVQFKYKHKPQLITLMSSSIHNLEILGAGMKTLLYTANLTGKLAIYNIRQIRSTFDYARRPSIAVGMQNSEQQATRPTLAPQQLANIQNLAQSVVNELDNEVSQRMKELSVEEDEEYSDVHQLLENEIEPTYHLRYKGELAQFICHARQILAYLTISDKINGKVRFFNLFSEQQVFEHKFEGSYPITCQIYARDTQGGSQTYAQIGMSNGRIYEICLHNKTVVEVPLEQRVNQQENPSTQGQSIEKQESLSNKPITSLPEDTSLTLESLASENRFVGDILGVITEQEDEQCENLNNIPLKDENIETVPYILTDKIFSVFCKKDLMLLQTGDRLLSFKRCLGGKHNGVYYLLVTECEMVSGERPNYGRIFNNNDVIIATAIYNDGKVMKADYNIESNTWNITYLE